MKEMIGWVHELILGFAQCGFEQVSDSMFSVRFLVRTGWGRGSASFWGLEVYAKRHYWG